MKIYLAATAPGNEQGRINGMLKISRRLLSFYHIIENQFEAKIVFQLIIKETNNAKNKS